MRRTRAFVVETGILLLLCGFMAACQTTDSPAPPVSFGGASRLTAPPLPSPSARKVAERKGWVVEAVAATLAEPAHCRTGRPADNGPSLAFRASPGRFGVSIRTLDRLLAPGASYELTFTFEGAASESHTAQATDSGTLAVLIRSLDYEDITDAFVRAQHLEISSPQLGGRIAAFPLAGSNWAINALDECRRIHTTN